MGQGNHSRMQATAWLWNRTASGLDYWNQLWHCWHCDWNVAATASCGLNQHMPWAAVAARPTPIQDRLVFKLHRTQLHFRPSVRLSVCVSVCLQTQISQFTTRLNTHNGVFAFTCLQPAQTGTGNRNPNDVTQASVEVEGYTCQYLKRSNLKSKLLQDARSTLFCAGATTQCHSFSFLPVATYRWNLTWNSSINLLLNALHAKFPFHSITAA